MARRLRSRGWLRRVAAGLAVAVACYAAAATVYIAGPGGRDARRPASVIIVLGGGATAGVPSPEYQARLDHADVLRRAGFAPIILCTGGPRVGTGGPEALAARRYLQSRGVPAAAILVEPRSHATWQNLRNARVIMRGRGWRTALLVTNRFHMGRARLMARALRLDVAPSPSPDAPPAAPVRKVLLELAKLTVWLARGMRR